MVEEEEEVDCWLSWRMNFDGQCPPLSRPVQARFSVSLGFKRSAAGLQHPSSGSRFWSGCTRQCSRLFPKRAIAEVIQTRSKMRFVYFCEVTCNMRGYCTVPGLPWHGCNQKEKGRGSQGLASLAG